MAQDRKNPNPVGDEFPAINVVRQIPIDRLIRLVGGARAGDLIEVSPNDFPPSVCVDKLRGMGPQLSIPVGRDVMYDNTGETDEYGIRVYQYREPFARPIGQRGIYGRDTWEHGIHPVDR